MIHAGTAIVSHLIAYAEVHAAFAKRLRMEDLTEAAYDQCLAQFESDWADALVIQVDGTICGGESVGAH
jgi:hypothetical protein